jgi:hypothetical protein
MNELIMGLLGILIVVMIATAIQYRLRHDTICHCLGVDMGGIDQIKTFRGKIDWIKSRPDYRACHSPYDILNLWEKREKVLDTIAEQRC